MSTPHVGDNTGENTSDSVNSGQRSPGLALLGILALAVSAWGIAGGPTLPDPSALAWIAVIAATATGLVLVLAGARSARR